MSIFSDLGDLVKKTILTGAALGATLFSAQHVYAQGFDQKVQNKKDTAQTLSVSDDDSTAARKIDAWVSGYVRAEAYSSPSRQGVSGGGQLSLNLDDTTRLNFYALGAWQKFDNANAEDLEVTATRLMAGLGHYLAQSPEFEFYVEGFGGKEWNSLEQKNSMSMNADKTIYGGQAGIASQKTGSKLLINGYWGDGNYDAEFESGFESKGDFDTVYFGGEFSQRLFGEGQKFKPKGTFDVDRDLGEEFERSLHLAVSWYTRNDKYKDVKKMELQDADGWGLRVALPYVYNVGTGNLWEFSLFGQFESYDTRSDRSERTTDSDRWRLGVRGKYTHKKSFEIFGELGPEWYGLKTDDPGLNIHDKHEKNGLFVAGGIDLRF